MLCRLICLLLFLAWTEESRLLMYEGHWKSPLDTLSPVMRSVPGLGLSPWQLALFALVPASLLWRGGWRRRPWAMDLAVFISLASIALTFLWGMVRGGSAYNAAFQLSAFLNALLLGVALGSALRRSGDVKAVGLTLLAAALTRSTLVLYFYYSHVRGRMQPPPSYMTSHEDSLLFVAAVLVVVSWALARRSGVAWLTASVVSGYVLWAMVLNDRRLAWVELVFVLGFVYLLLPRGTLRQRVNIGLAGLAPAVLLYVAVGWGRPEAVFAPVHALATSGSNQDASSLARLEEVRNLIYTLAESGNPLLGTGWGQPYTQVTNYYSQFGPDWWQHRYMPHNSLIAVAVFGGLVGLLGMWLVVPMTAFLGTRGYLGARGPTERAGAMAAVCVLPAYAAQCYGDIGLQQLSCAMILAVAMAVAARASAWSDYGVRVSTRRASRSTRNTTAAEAYTISTGAQKEPIRGLP